MRPAAAEARLASAGSDEHSELPLPWARREVVAVGESGRFTALGWHQGRGLDSQPLGIGGQNLSPRFQGALQEKNS